MRWPTGRTTRCLLPQEGRSVELLVHLTEMGIGIGADCHRGEALSRVAGPSLVTAKEHPAQARGAGPTVLLSGRLRRAEDALLRAVLGSGDAAATGQLRGRSFLPVRSRAQEVCAALGSYGCDGVRQPPF
jgi:hypothetical protein